jgi:hypothetical protein
MNTQMTRREKIVAVNGVPSPVFGRDALAIMGFTLKPFEERRPLGSHFTGNCAKNFYALWQCRPMKLRYPRRPYHFPSYFLPALVQCYIPQEIKIIRSDLSLFASEFISSCDPDMFSSYWDYTDARTIEEWNGALISCGIHFKLNWLTLPKMACPIKELPVPLFAQKLDIYQERMF